MNLVKKSSISALVGLCAVVFAISMPAKAENNPFASQELMTIAHVEETKKGKCGEGKMKAEGKCGEGKMKAKGKCGEGKCGEGKMKAKGKCGEGKMKAEGKCGEGKNKKCGG